MSDPLQLHLLNVNNLQEPLLKRVGELLDQPTQKGWRKLAEIVGIGGRFKLSSLELQQCSLKVMEAEGSPSRTLLRFLGDRGLTAKELVDFLQAMGHTEAIHCLKPPGLKIVVQPESLAACAGQLVKLCCLASGHPAVQYQWFKVNKEVLHGNSPELVFNPLRVSDVGFYICRVNNFSSFEFSQWAQLDVCEVDANCGSLAAVPENKLHICKHPQPQKLNVGDTLVLKCGAVGKPLPRYQWLKNGSPLKDGTKKLYEISCVTMEHQGMYCCRVFNDQDYQISKEANVVIGCRTNLGVAVEITEEELSGFTAAEPAMERLFATDKVALLIGNMTYQNHSQLKAPMVDVYELTNLLRQLDFKVVSLLDLTEPEMRNAVDEFLLLLDKGVYGLLYYAGHGYENYGNSFMVPINAPNPYRSANCLCVQSILKLMQEKETGLNIFLLDMCRKRNEYDDTILIPDALRVTANIVFGYATCQGAEAFEIQHSGLSNGIFMKFLKERLLEDKKITVLLDGVAEDMGKCHLTKGKQALEIRSSLSEKRALTDPIQQAACSAESLARNLQWAKAHELPESTCLEFDCGVQIKLGFAAEFSNVLIIYTRIVQKPPDIIVCEAFVTDFPLDLDVDPKETNKGTPEETGSYLVSKDLPKHCLYTRLSALQKLKERLTFTVCLHYQYQGMEDTVEERKIVDVGKPLIAKLDIYHGFRRNSCLQTCSMPHSPSHSLCSSPVPSRIVDEQYLSPHSHHYSNSHIGLRHPDQLSSSGGMQLTSCEYSLYSNVLGSNQRTQSNLAFASTLNIPVETTDDPREELSTMTDSLSVSNK
ncbi:mucosa-associated lymphoid tissue lymphoma translocation protein 1 [Microcaecilia unicolor]|uniref:Mucosa-associated lymphoid tissue lymphoma translocation protein 1 n=1 Tax=Microcaecilia unicolor TaxID=1415580 RepID=A0A6P7ZHD5_9AMPH|nr:mucosa-associated lymphoid tissue lymphoma translocation protein 1 [Microcaecilia unicolor]XP_030074870.1 mucosa-associated lymphoid tissue lymphoma translocation protein 1 [Microcaecilia unicolor]